MAQESMFRGVISFLDQIGMYDIVLPFLLIFTIVFAIFEKTRILGIEKIDGKEYTKKNLNAMIAFVIAFLVIASTQLVAVINQVMAQIVLLLLLAVSFLLLVGVFFGTGEFTLKDYPNWIKFFMFFMFIGIVAIFLNSLGWLSYFTSLGSNWNPEWTSGIIFLIIILGFMYYITKDSSPPKETKK